MKKSQLKTIIKSCLSVLNEEIQNPEDTSWMDSADLADEEDQRQCAADMADPDQDGQNSAIDEGPSAIKPILSAVQRMIERNPFKKDIHAVVRIYKGDPYLEVRANDPSIIDFNSGNVELQDAYGNITQDIEEKLNLRVVERDVTASPHGDYIYTMFELPSVSGIRENLAKNVPNKDRRNK